MIDAIEVVCGRAAEDGNVADLERAVIPLQATDFKQLEAKRLDLREHPVERGLVAQRSRQHGVAAARPSPKGRERGAHRLAQAAADTDTVPVRRRIVACTGHFHLHGSLLLIRPILTASLGAGRVNGHRMIDVISCDDQRPCRLRHRRDAP